MVEVRDLDDHEAAWDALVLQQPIPSPFLRSWWLAAMPASGRRYLLVLLDGCLVGGAPMTRDRLATVRRYRFLGAGPLCPDHLDLLVAPGHTTLVTDAFAAWFEAPGARILDVAGLVEDAVIARAVRRSTRQIDVAPYQKLPPSTKAYLSGRSSSTRRSVRRSEQRLAAAGLVHRRVQPEAYAETLEAFVRLQSDRAGREAMLALFDRLDRALAAGSRRGEIQIDVIASDDEIAAVSLAWKVGGRLSLYQIARSIDARHDGAGTVMLSLLIRNAIDDGLVEVDLLRGGEGYKGSFVDSVRQLHRLRAGHGVRARLVVTAWEAASRWVRRSRALRARVTSRQRRPVAA